MIPTNDRDSVTRLVGAVLQEQHEERQDGQRRHFSDPSMRELVYILHETTEPTRLDLYLTAGPHPPHRNRIYVTKKA